MLFPVLFAAGQTAVLVGALASEHSVTWLAKWLTVPSIPVLLALLADRVSRRPERWRVVAAVWATLGVGVVLVVTAAIEWVTERIGNAAYWRLWPTTVGPGEQRMLDEIGGHGPGWTPTGITVRELSAVVLVALAAALALRWCARRGAAPVAAIVVPVAVFIALLAYSATTPWSFRMDFDFFVGDAVLGATFGELVFVVAPFDPIGSIAIGLAALSMGALLAVWRPASAPVAGERGSEAIEVGLGPEAG